MLLILLDVAPFGFCATVWVVFTQGPSVRLFCQPLSGSPSPCRVKARSPKDTDWKGKQSGSFRDRGVLCYQQLCWFIGFIKFKTRLVSWFELLVAARLDHNPVFLKDT